MAGSVCSCEVDSPFADIDTPEALLAYSARPQGAP
jgi:hypothetical protein